MQSEFNTKYIQLDVVLFTTNHFTMKQLNMKCSLFSWNSCEKEQFAAFYMKFKFGTICSEVPWISYLCLPMTLHRLPDPL